MRELRLVPLAFLIWGIIIFHNWALYILIATAGILLVYKRPIYAGLYSVVGLLVYIRLLFISDYIPHGCVHGTILSTPRETAAGNWVNSIRIEGHHYSVLTPNRVLENYDANSFFTIHDHVDICVEELSSRNLFNPMLITQEIHNIVERSNWSEKIKNTFLDSVYTYASGHGLIPGMVVGDIRLQSVQEQEIYTLTGLSHLSAVSGSNVAIIMSAVAIICMRFRPRIRLFFCACALFLFIMLIGPEPSVLRAGAMGAVGLVSILNHNRVYAVHALSLAVIILLLYDPSLAMSYGFILSVAATAGILFLYPVFLPLFKKFPIILARCCAVCIAADIVTQPIIVHMSGRISLVSIMCNICAAPMVAPITVLGMIACLLSLLPGGFEALPLWLCHKGALWIEKVAIFGHSLSWSSLAMDYGYLGVWWTILAVLWIHAGALYITKNKYNKNKYNEE